MATQAGEENVATLFGDVHYFYSPADAKPRHHRFDKGSYVYLFENAGERRCRIEVANHPGTDEQDAFDGFLDQTHVRYSYKHHCMVSLAVADSVNQSEWHLPTYDPRNENKYHYKLHSLDIYFWTQQDALRFVNGIRRVLPPAQVEVLDEPGPPPQPAAAGMSAVVQKLENAAISDPRYNNSAETASHAASQDSAGARGDASASSDAPGASLPPPPPPPPPASFAPMAYNPAAPAAPEAIRYREKTPPPDEDPLNPVAVAVAYDYHRQPFTPGVPPPSQFPPAVASPGLPPPQYGAPPTHPGIQRAATMPLPSGPASPGLVSPYGAGAGFVPPPPPPATQPPTTQPLPPPNQTTPAATPAAAPPPPAANPEFPGPPAGGPPNQSYSTYSQQGHAPPGPLDYSIHQQIYQPTEEELLAQKPKPYQPKQEGRGRLEHNAARLERGVSGMLKKFEKRFG